MTEDTSALYNSSMSLDAKYKFIKSTLQEEGPFSTLEEALDYILTTKAVRVNFRTLRDLTDLAFKSMYSIPKSSASVEIPELTEWVEDEERAGNFKYVTNLDELMGVPTTRKLSSTKAYEMFKIWVYAEHPDNPFESQNQFTRAVMTQFGYPGADHLQKSSSHRFPFFVTKFSTR